MKITAIKTFMGVYGSRPRGLLKVETDEGIYGWGETYSIGPDLSVEPISDYLEKMIVGEDPRRIEYLMLKIRQEFRFPPGGVGLAVTSAVDHALWDISGKAAGLPVYMLLGGSVRDRVRVYNGIGGSNGKQVAERVQALNETYGFTAFKSGPFQLDIYTHRWGQVCAAAAAHFEDIRKHCPDHYEFAFDPHAKIFEPIKALQLANAMAPYDPYFYEEPLRPEHIPAWAKLRAQMQVPLATGESLYTRWEFQDLIAAQAADIIQPDVCVCGGLLEMRKIAAIAETHYVPVMPHNPMGPVATAVNVHFAAATPNFEILEYIIPYDEWKSWVDEPYVPVDGHLELRDRPGLGIDVNEEALTPGPLTVEDKAKLPHWQRRAPIRPDGSTGYI